MNVSDLPVFKQGGKLLAAVKKIPAESKACPVRGAAEPLLGDPGRVGRGGGPGEITSLVEQVREDLDKDMATVREAVSSDDAEQSSKDGACDRQKIFRHQGRAVVRRGAGLRQDERRLLAHEGAARGRQTSAGGHAGPDGQ